MSAQERIIALLANERELQTRGEAYLDDNDIHAIESLLSHAPQAGGFKGVLFTFGEGCDDDTVQSFLLVGDLCLDLTTTDGETCTVYGRSWDVYQTDVPDDPANGTFGLWAQRWDGDVEPPENKPLDFVPFDDIAGIHIH